MESPIIISFELNRSTKGSQNLRSGNEMINANDRMHFHVRSQLTDHLRIIACGETHQYIGRLPKGTSLYSKEHPCHVFVHIFPPTNRRMDAPNWYPTVKALIDGLTDTGLFIDDNDQVITSFTFFNGGKSGNKKYRIVLEIRPGDLRVQGKENNTNA